MQSQSGHLLLLKTPSGAIANQSAQPTDAQFSNYTGFQSNTIDFSATAIDVTNKSTSENMKILDEHGIKSYVVSGSGFFQDEALHKEIETNMLNQKLRWFQIERDDNVKLTGLFKIASFSLEGSYDGALTFSITLNSSGAVAIS